MIKKKYEDFYSENFEFEITYMQKTLSEGIIVCMSWVININIMLIQYQCCLSLFILRFSIIHSYNIYYMYLFR